MVLALFWQIKVLTTEHTVKSKGKILQNFVAFSEYMNLTKQVSKPRGRFFQILCASQKVRTLTQQTF